MENIKSIEEIKERIEYEKRYSQKILVDGLKKFNYDSNGRSWFSAQRSCSLSEERLDTLRWVLNEINLHHDDE
jgi:hypothetical protein